jgi:hypothetical protein
MVPFEVRPNTIQESNDFKGVLSVIQVNNGYLLGFDAGEWGGSLYWFSKNGKQHNLISRDQVSQFIRTKGSIYAIEGLSHGGISEGSIIEIKQISDKWKADKFFILSSAPKGIALDGQKNFIVVCTSGLFKIDKRKQINTLLGNSPFGQLPPTSLVIKGNDAYIGMYQHVFKYNFITGDKKILINEKLVFIDH